MLPAVSLLSGVWPKTPSTQATRKFYKGFRDNARSRKSGQPGQSDPGEEVLNSEVGSRKKIPCEQRFLSCMTFSAYEVVRVAVTYSNTVTIGEIKTGNARFHALTQFDLHSFDQNILSFKNTLF